jgi:hypothetical protein
MADLEQNGVVLRLGLALARLAPQVMVDIIVVEAGDSDWRPPFDLPGGKEFASFSITWGRRCGGG